MALEIATEIPVPIGLRPKLRRVLTALCKANQISSDICIILTDDDRLRALKLEFWQEDATTDVLTFPQWEPSDLFMPPVLGDIYINLEMAAQQAAERNHSLTTEVILLAAHGLTHLIGFDHQTPEAWQRFYTMERLALTHLSQA